MNKKIFSMAALAALTMAGMTSCSDDTIENGTDAKSPKALSFAVQQNNSIATRGLGTTSLNFLDQITDFQVVGFYSDGSGRYVGSADNIGTIIDGDGAGNWNYHVPTQVQYWPAGNIDFQAITPAADDSFTLTNVPEAGSSRLAANVTIPAEVANQKDIMFASATDVNNAATGEAVGLTFKHALTQVLFAGKVASDNITATVNEIEICNVHNTGNVGFLASKDALSAVATGDAKASFKAGLLAAAADRTMASTDKKNLTAANGALMMIPQEQTAWTHAGAEKAIADATGAYIRISCKVQDKTSGTWLIGANEGNGEFENVYIPFDMSAANSKAWEMGKKYTYTIVFGNGSNSYNENGDDLKNLVPISYTVDAAEDWTEATANNVEF